MLNVLLLSALLVSPVQPISYSWTIRPAPLPPWITYRLDTCHVTLRATEATSAKVILYYFPPGGGIGAVGMGDWEWVSFPANTNVTVNRDIGYNYPCPCSVCVVQNCPNGTTHTQCGYVLRPGEALPPNWWTPFSHLANLPVCPTPPNSLFRDGFELGTTGAWSRVWTAKGRVMVDSSGEEESNDPD